MFFIKLFFVQLCVLIISCASRSPVEIKRWMLIQSIECSDEHKVSSEEMHMLLSLKLPESKNAMCYVACIFKKINWINKNGDFDYDKTMEFAKEEYADNATMLENSKKVYETCKKVNDEPVTDGKNGCDRAKFLAQCLIENASKAGFNLENM